jgi:hypothetical protein
MARCPCRTTRRVISGRAPGRTPVRRARGPMVGDLMDTAGREAQVRRFVEEVWNGRNYEACSELYGEDYMNPFGKGPAAKAPASASNHRAFPDDMRVEIDDLIVAGDRSRRVRRAPPDRAGSRGMGCQHHAIRERSRGERVHGCRQTRPAGPIP